MKNNFSTIRGTRIQIPEAIGPTINLFSISNFKKDIDL